MKMRTFDVGFYYSKKNKNLVYRDLEGQKAIKLMESLEKKGFSPLAETKSFGTYEYLTLRQMKEAVL